MLMVDSAAAEYIRGREPSDNCSSDSTFQLIERWVKDCQNSHEERASLTIREQPTYLVDLEAEDLSTLSGPSQIRLIRTYAGLKNSDYIALSYVWGVKRQPVAHIIGNRSQRMAHFQEDSLPQTLRYGIFVARRLKIRYIWVDVLCIVQDDPGEKRKEIARIHHIFASSFLTLQAGRSPAVTDGFLALDRTLVCIHRDCDLIVVRATRRGLYSFEVDLA